MAVDRVSDSSHVIDLDNKAKSVTVLLAIPCPCGKLSMISALFRMNDRQLDIIDFCLDLLPRTIHVSRHARLMLHIMQRLMVFCLGH